MYVLKGENGYVREHTTTGFGMAEELDKAKMFPTIPELLQFVSLYIPDHRCGIYEIVSIQEVQRPRYIEDRVMG